MKNSSMKETFMNTHMGNIVIDNEVIAQYAAALPWNALAWWHGRYQCKGRSCQTAQNGKHDKRNQCVHQKQQADD